MNKPQPARKWTKRFAILLGVLVLIWLLLSYAVAYKLTRRHPQQQERTPDITWGKMESFRLQSADGLKLGAWFIDGKAEYAPVLILHGNGGSRSACLEEAKLAHSAGHPVLLLTFRAHGDSEGEHNDIGYSGRQDVEAGVEWLTARCPGRSVIIWGQSLGSAAALFASANLGERISGYILECPYKDLRTCIRNRTKLHLPPLLDQIAFLGLLTVSPIVLPELDQISPKNAIANIPPSANVLILTGDADRRAGVDEAVALATKSPGKTELVCIEGGDHLQLRKPDPEQYARIILDFLKRCRQQEKVPDPN